METNVKVLELKDLRNPKLFMVGENGLIRRKSTVYESGELYHYTIRDFVKLRAKGDVVYRSKCRLEVQIGNRELLSFDCFVSPLLTYRILNNRDKYVDVTFVSYNTTPEYTCNPLKLVKCKDGSYGLYSVTEGGHKFNTITLPGGEEVVKMEFINNKREYYQRFHNAFKK